MHNDNFIIIGCGGIGANLALKLSGVAKRIIVIDNDKVELSNLNRIPIPFGNIGRLKVSAIADKSLLEARKAAVFTYNGCVNSIDDLRHVLESINMVTDSILKNWTIVDCRDTLNPQVMFKEIEWKLTYDGGSFIALSFSPQTDCDKILSIGDGYQTIPSFYLTPAIQCDLFIEFIKSLKTKVDVTKALRTSNVSFEITDKIAASKVDIKKLLKNYRARV